MKASLLGFAVVLAWLTKRFIEDPWILRHRAAPPRSVLMGVAAGMLVIALGGLGLQSQAASRAALTGEQARADAAGPCFGPAAIEIAACKDPFNSPVKDPHMGPENEYWGLPADCRQRDDTLHTKQPSGPAVCDFAEMQYDAESVWLVGDCMLSNGRQPSLSWPGRSAGTSKSATAEDAPSPMPHTWAIAALWLVLKV